MDGINSIGSSPVSTEESSSAYSNLSAVRAAHNAAAVGPVPQDWVEIANVPALAQVEPLQSINPTRFHSVLSDAIRQLRKAEVQTADPLERAYYSNLADRFQRLQETGVPDLSMSATTST